MPTVLNILGLRFYFYSREHEPIHVHVEKGGNVAKFEFTEFEVKEIYNKGLKVQEIKLAKEIIKDNRNYIIGKWKEIFGE